MATKTLKYPVYKIFPEPLYGGSALVAAQDAEEANEFIRDFKKYDLDNARDSKGYEEVTELCNRVDYIYATCAGILDYGIYYTG